MKHKIFIGITSILISASSIAQNNNEVSPPPPLDTADRIFSKVEYEAEFPGGLSAWAKYLQKNLDPNVPIRNRARNGTYKVVVKFIVTRDGTISNIQAETNFGHGMEEEVIRVIQNGPKWIPAMQNGRKVNAYRRQPVTFVVSG